MSGPKIFPNNGWQKKIIDPFLSSSIHCIYIAQNTQSALHGVCACARTCVRACMVHAWCVPAALTWVNAPNALAITVELRGMYYY